MYENFYHLSSDPFRLLPDPGICFPHRSGSRAWAYLRYALKRGEGIVVVTGPPGSGKTTLAQRLLSETNPAQVVTVRLVANDLTPTDLMRKLAYALGLPVEGKDRAMLSLLVERHLIEVQHAQRRVLVVIDEAQTLSHQSLEAMRLLTDLQSQTRPVLQLVLFGQEELEGVMSAPGMEQFQHRVIASCRLQPMDLMETKAYLEYRLGAVNWRGDPSINGPAVMAIYRYSHGVPRHVNKICSRLMLHGSSEERHALDEHDVMAVVRDLRSELLAPLTHDATAQDATVNALTSVYELALVPSPMPQSQFAGQTSRVLEDWPLDDEGSTSSVSTEGRPYSRRPLSRGDAGGASRYVYRAGRRPRPSSRRRLWRRLRVGRDQLRQLLDLALAGRESLGQRMRPLLADGAKNLHGWAESGRRWVRDAWKQVRVVAARPLWGQPLGLIAGGAAGALLLALIVTKAAIPTTELVAASDGRLPAAMALGEHASLANGVLADSSAYLWSASSAERRGLVAGSKELVSHMLGDLFADETADIDGLRGVLGPGVALPRLHKAGGKVSVVSDGPGLQPLLGAISDTTTSRLVGATGRFESSLSVWALARHPDVAAGEKVNVWSLHPTTGEASLQAVLPRDPREGAPELASLAGSEPMSADSAVELLAASDSPVPRIVHVAEDGTSLKVAADDPGSRDYSLSLPPTAAGGTREPNSASDSAAGAVIDVAHDTPMQPAERTVEVSEEAVEPEAIAADAQSSDKGIEIELAAVGRQPPQAVSLPVSAQPVQAVEPPQVDVSDLIEQANKAIAADRLLMPKNRSAYHYLQRALEIDRENAVARHGLKRIAERYTALANQALKEESYDKAGRYVERGLRVVPGDSRLLTLREEVGFAREEAAAVALAEAEMARLAAQPEPEPEPEPKPPPKKKPSNFQSLMRLVEGI